MDTAQGGWESTTRNCCLQERSENLIKDKQDFSSVKGRNKEKKEIMES